MKPKIFAQLKRKNAIAMPPSVKAHITGESKMPISDVDMAFIVDAIVTREEQALPLLTQAFDVIRALTNRSGFESTATSINAMRAHQHAIAFLQKSFLLEVSPCR